MMCVITFQILYTDFVDPFPSQTSSFFNCLMISWPSESALQDLSLA